jgi:hypothetical protein
MQIEYPIAIRNIGSESSNIALLINKKKVFSYSIRNSDSNLYILVCTFELIHYSTAGPGKHNELGSWIT